MCVKNNREVNDGKRVAKRQDVFNIVRLGTFCLEKKCSHREPVGD